MATAQQLPDVLDDPHHPTKQILRRVWERLNVSNEHWMHCIVGEEGSGKSYTALKIGELVDRDFSAESVFFRPKKLIELLKDDEYDTGDVYVVDEAGVGLGKRTWQDREQVQVNQALQLIRSHNVGVIFTLPSLGELDSQTQTRLQTVYELLSKEDGEHVKGNWWIGSTDRMGFTGDTWWDKPKHNGKEVETVSFTPPSDEIVKPYEERKSAFQKQFYAETVGDEEAVEDDEDDTPTDIVEQIQNGMGVQPLLGWHGGHNKWTLSKQKIREEFDCSIRDAKAVKDKLVEHPDIDIQTAKDAKPQPHTQDDRGSSS